MLQKLKAWLTLRAGSWNNWILWRGKRAEWSTGKWAYTRPHGPWGKFGEEESTTFWFVWKFWIARDRKG